MATLDETLEGLRKLIIDRAADETIAGLTVGTMWPAEEDRQVTGKSPNAVIAIVEKTTAFKPAGMPFAHSVTNVPPTIASALSETLLRPGQTIALTLSRPSGITVTNAEDLVAFGFGNEIDREAITYSTTANQTLNQIAAALAALINANANFSASATGAVITITNDSGSGFYCRTAVSSITVLKRTVNWANRNCMIVIWAGSLDKNSEIYNFLESLLADLDTSSGFALESGEWVELSLVGSKPKYDDTDKDTYGSVFIVDLGHFVDQTIKQWGIVATQQEVGFE